MLLYHIAEADAWERALQNGFYRPASLSAEGFIHCSTAAQLPVVAERFYAHVPELLLLHIVDRRVRELLRWEPAPDAPELGPFPHLYGKLSVHAVEDVSIVGYRPDGTGRDWPALV